MFATTDLVRPLQQRGVELSRQMIHRVVTRPRSGSNMDLLAALCDIVECAPSDLIQMRLVEAGRPARQRRRVGHRGPTPDPNHDPPTG